MFNTFNPYAPYPPTPFQPPQFMPPQMQQQTQNRGPVVLYVPSAKDFNNVSVQPGQQALVIAQNDPFIAFKNADAMGMVQTTLCRLQSVTSDEIDGQGAEYVTRQEFQQTIQQLLDNMQKPARTKKEAMPE